MNINFLLSDYLFFLVLIIILTIAIFALKKKHVKTAWQKAFSNKIAVVSGAIILTYLLISILDSIHFNPNSEANPNAYSHHRISVLDQLLAPLGKQYEKSYSKPFAKYLYSKETVIDGQQAMRQIYPKLKHAGQNDITGNMALDISLRLLYGIFKPLGILLVLVALTILVYAMLKKKSLAAAVLDFRVGFERGNLLLFLSTLLLMIVLFSCALELSKNYHILGTGQVGQDIFYMALKSIRTGMMIGLLTTLVMLPFALFLGVSAGYFGGIIDDVIQYIYTTLSSIPGVLLIAASVLSMQVYISNHPQWFESLAERADARLLTLCFILGITSWTGLCRMLRAETLKLREMDYVQAGRALGTRHQTILAKHILPNVMHLVIIAVVLDFSFLVLAEAVLSYVGVGVSATTISWGNMINAARLELAREPAVWWPILAAFIFMFTLVLAINLFADAVRDAFDPRNA